jgi:PadR family transcriptional regulator, regulatory protein PadR
MAAVLGSFEQAVLLAVFRLRGEAYGRSILAGVETRLGREVAAGAVHATLSRLERKGLLASHIGDGSEVRAGRPRRHYRLEASGRRALNEARAAADHLWSGFTWPLKGLKGS